MNSAHYIKEWVNEAMPHILATLNVLAWVYGLCFVALIIIVVIETRNERKNEQHKPTA